VGLSWPRPVQDAVLVQDFNLFLIAGICLAFGAEHVPTINGQTLGDYALYGIINRRYIRFLLVVNYIVDKKMDKPNF
jgi:hypothetical protein